MWRDDAFVLDMLLAARKVLEFAKGRRWEQFSGEELLQNAVMRQIQIIGEAARRVSQDYQRGHPEVPWRSIVACGIDSFTSTSESFLGGFGTLSRRTFRS